MSNVIWKQKKFNSQKINEGATLEEIILARQIIQNTQSNKNSIKNVHSLQSVPKIQAKDIAHTESTLVVMLQKYCHELEYKVKELEFQLSLNNDSTNKPTKFSPNRVIERRKSSVKSLVTMNETFASIDSSVHNLVDLFRGGDPFHRRNRSATIIAAIIRGFIVRRRYQVFLRNLKIFKLQRCNKAVMIIRSLCHQQKNIVLNIEQATLRKRIQLFRSIFRQWKFLNQINSPRRKAFQRLSDEYYKNKMMSWLRLVFTSMKSVCIGDKSLKVFREHRKQLALKVKEELRLRQCATDNGSISIISDEKVEQGVHRYLVAEFQMKLKMAIVKKLFLAFKDNLKNAKKSDRKARNHWFRKVAKNIVYAWRHVVQKLIQGTQLQPHHIPRSTILRYNQRKVDIFARKRLLRFTFYPLRIYCNRMSIVNKKFRSIASKLAFDIFISWRNVAKDYRSLRKSAIQKWLDYPIDILKNPFKEWKIIAKSTSKIKEYGNVIVKSYSRIKAKRRLMTIIRAWKHLTFYGKMDALYTKQEIMASLTEQKKHGNTMTKLIATQLKEIEEYKSILSNELEKRSSLEFKMTQVKHEMEEQKILCHHAQQEVLRLQALIDSMVIINPKQFNQLKRLQHTDFQFRQRTIVSNQIPSDLVETKVSSILSDDSKILDDATEETVSEIPVPGIPLEDDKEDIEKENNVVVENNQPDSIQVGNKSISQEDYNLLDRIKWLSRQLSFEAFLTHSSKATSHETSSTINIADIENKISDINTTSFLFNILMFIFQGDSSLLYEKDRLDWIHHLTKFRNDQAEVHSSPSRKVIPTDLENIAALTESISATLPKSFNCESDVNHPIDITNNDNSITLTSLLRIETSWQTVFQNLLSLHPSAGNKKDWSISSDNIESNVQTRICDMKSRLLNIMHDVENKNIDKISLIEKTQDIEINSSQNATSRSMMYTFIEQLQSPIVDNNDNIPI